MEINKKYARTTQAQLEVYINFIGEHPELLAGKNTPVAPNRINELWAELASQMNSVMGPSKTATVWKESLRNWRKQLMFRARKLRAETLKTGGGRKTVQGLTEFEERALEAFGMVAVTGVNMPDLGFGMENDVQDQMDLLLNSPDCVASTVPATASSSRLMSAPVPVFAPPVVSVQPPAVVFSPPPAAVSVQPPPVLSVQPPAVVFSPPPAAVSVEPTAAMSLPRRAASSPGTTEGPIRHVRQHREELLRLAAEDMRLRQQERADRQQMNQTLAVLATAMTELVQLQKELLGRTSQN